ncbi:uncharacterized protein LOC113683445 [Pocillopora damicornis]|uniref:uncharacterized protein LOC113683445 n=1 Tax=Pocillopora damicornis TaxID=46731 RepID=UPI000F5544E0|nr:uncharacterized protein LOC113683445 [Pocillopora damicornis]
MLSSLILCLIVMTFSRQTTASHFRGGIITWKPGGNNSNKVLFNFRLGFRRSYSYSYYCDNSMVASQSIVGSGDSWRASHDKGYYSSFRVASTGYHCTDFSVQEDWSQGENSFEYTFWNEGPWLISYTSCCWISLANGGNGDWLLSTTVNLTRRQDSGKINSSPISAISPIVRHQQGCPKTITIPAEDSDGDKVRCRWSNGSRRECGDVCHSFQSGTLDEEKCTLSLHSNIALGWHAVAITLEDYPASTTNFQSATPYSHVSLQFLVHVSPSSGPCNRAPVLIGQSPNDGSCEEVSNGNTFNSVIEAKHIDSSRSITEIITVTPLYMVISGLLNYTDSIGDTVFYRNVSWNPRLSQKGRHIFCFKAVDNFGIESKQRCITIIVGSNNTPNPLLYSRVPVVPRLSWPWWFGFVDFNITFDQQIKRPRHSKFIRIVVEDHVIYKLDTRSSSEVTVDKFSLKFRLPQVVLSMRGNYSITMDRGVVVGLGCTSDGPPSPGFSSLKDWPFDVGVCSKGTYMGQNNQCSDVNECSKAPSILSRKKRSHRYWRYYTSAQAMASSMPTTSFSPTPAFAVAATSSISVVDGKTLKQLRMQRESPFIFTFISECTSHYLLEDFGRSVNYVGNVTCDRGLAHGWYRFRGAAGTQMPTYCVRKYHCGTHAPGWLRGAHPSVADGIIRALVCFHWGSQCCSWSTIIRVRNCGGFYVYELRRPPACHLRYCGEGNVQSTPVMRTFPSVVTSLHTSANSLNIRATVATVMPVASSTPFVLHLPANCQHDCVNTWGSYYCTCRQGYRLEADGKTCRDINECLTQNGGCTHQCVNIPGGHYCKCPEGVTMGFDNKTCHEPGITVKCTAEAMFIFLERKTFQGFDPNKLTLLYPSCRASYNDSHISLRTSLNDCGTTHNESEDAITFYNKVRSVQSYSGNIITREQNVSIPFYCSYGRKALLRNPSFKTWKNHFTASEGGYGNFTFTMDLFKTGRYLTPFSYNDYPITVHLRDQLFLQLTVQSHQSNLVLFVDTCKATPTPDPYSVPQYVFLQRGCKLDSTLNYSYSISSKQRFSIQAFRFIEDHPVVHLHCEVLACHRNTARSRCLQGCSRYRGRRDEVPGSESTQVYEMSSGPIKYQNGASATDTTEAEIQTNMEIITVVAASGGFCLLLVIILTIVVIRIKKRLKGAFADRNKVYAMEQCGNHVKEDNNNNLGFVQDDELNEMGYKPIIMKPRAPDAVTSERA